MQRLYRSFAAVIAWFGLVLQLVLMLWGQSGPELIWRTVNFFSFFTILSNILVALALTLPLLAPDSGLGRFLGKASVRTAIVTYITFVCIVYHLLLRHIWNPQGWQLVADNTLHYLTPVLYIVDWLAFVSKGTVSFKAPLLWLGFPIIYALYSLVRGAVTGWYPYPFIDAAALGYDRVFVNIVGLIVAFLVLGLVYVAIDRALARVWASTA